MDSHVPADEVRDLPQVTTCDKSRTDSACHRMPAGMDKHLDSRAYPEICYFEDSLANVYVP